MENIRDWCISRQIWWGHRIPVWYCKACGQIIVVEKDPDICPSCKSENLIQDEDVLDTWFSSWLWPFSTMGWPENSGLMQKFYPTDTLVTAPEILFFWVSRMIMAGLHFTGKLPFENVILHGTVRDKTGKKMSKSLGNAIDPLEIIATHGADALRFSLINITAQGADVYLSKDTFDVGRNFSNKLWNASRFLLDNIADRPHFKALTDQADVSFADTWILSRLNKTIASVCSSLATFRTNECAHTLYDFIWHDFCDWYIEIKKSDLYQDSDPKRKRTALNLCSYVLGNILKLLHPLMPFITEEIWEHVRLKIDYPDLLDSPTIMNARYPVYNQALVNEAIEKDFSLLKDIIIALRTIRSENNIPPDKKAVAIIIPASEADERMLGAHIEMINSFARLSETQVSQSAQKPRLAGQSVVMGNQVFLVLEGLIDKDVERGRLEKEIGRVKKLCESTQARLAGANFVGKAPPEVVEKETEKYSGLLKNLEKLEKNLAALQ
jgi:valyl-tRNA synthetase